MIRGSLVQIPGLNVPVSPELREQLFSSNAAVFGISSGAAAGIEARLAAEALNRNPSLSGKILFIEDFPGSSGIKDPDVLRIGKNVHLCSILPVSEDAPERSVYGHVHSVGYPDHWISDMQSIQKGIDLRSGGSLRKRRRGTKETVPISPTDLIVYFSGFKEPKTERSALRQLLSIGKVHGKDLLIHFRPHPGERNRPDLKEAIENRDALLRGTWEIASPEIVEAGRSTNSLLTGVSDIVIAHPGTTSNFYMSPLRRKMICVMEFVSREDLARESYDYALTGRNTHLIERLEDLSAAIKALATDNSPESAALRRKQKRNALQFIPNRPPQYGQNVLAVLKGLLT